MTAFSDIVPSGFAAVNELSRDVYCIHHQGDDRPDDEGSKYP
jgi:hypothetical protein